MKKLRYYLIVLIPAAASASNQEPAGLAGQPIALTIGSNIFALAVAGIALGGYVMFKKK